mgnify:FL=1
MQRFQGRKVRNRVLYHHAGETDTVKLLHSTNIQQQGNGSQGLTACFGRKC